MSGQGEMYEEVQNALERMDRAFTTRKQALRAVLGLVGKVGEMYKSMARDLKDAEDRQKSLQEEVEFLREKNRKLEEENGGLRGHYNQMVSAVTEVGTEDETEARRIQEAVDSAEHQIERTRRSTDDVGEQFEAVLESIRKMVESIDEDGEDGGQTDKRIQSAPSAPQQEAERAEEAPLSKAG